MGNEHSRTPFPRLSTPLLVSSIPTSSGIRPKKTNSIAMARDILTKPLTIVPTMKDKTSLQKPIISVTSQTPAAPIHESELVANTTTSPYLIHQMQQVPALNADRHAKHLSDVSTAKNSASAISVAVRRSTTSSSPVKIGESVIRVDTKKKDLIISADGVMRNRFHVDELELADGLYVYGASSTFDPSNALGEIAAKDEVGKENFWFNHHVQIILDLRQTSTAIATHDNKQGGKGKGVAFDVKGKGKEHATTTVIDQMAKLGQDFYKYATRITIDVIFPPPLEGSVVIRTYGPRGPSKNHIGADFNVAVHTLGFKTVQKLVAQLENCLSIKFLEVVIHNPNCSNSQPFTLEQLMYALPFYDLRYEDWMIKWQGSYMTEAVDVGSFPIILMDKERSKWLRAQQRTDRVAKIAARKEQERIDNMVFVRQSIAPEWKEKPWFPQPFPPAPKSNPSNEKTNGTQSF